MWRTCEPPCSMAASIVFHSQGSPQSTGTPISHSLSVSTNGWKLTHVDGAKAYLALVFWVQSLVRSAHLAAPSLVPRWLAGHLLSGLVSSCWLVWVSSPVSRTSARQLPLQPNPNRKVEFEYRWCFARTDCSALCHALGHRNCLSFVRKRYRSVLGSSLVR
jgi:hypothetical protein